MTNEIIIAILGSGLLASIVSSGANIILWKLKNDKAKEDRNNDVVEGLQVLLYNEIKSLGLQYIAAGEIAAEDLEDLERTHKVYHDKLDGNGYLDDIMHKVRKLQLKTDRGA